MGIAWAARPGQAGGRGRRSAFPAVPGWLRRAWTEPGGTWRPPTRDTAIAVVITVIALLASYGEAHPTDPGAYFTGSHHLPHTPAAALLQYSMLVAAITIGLWMILGGVVVEPPAALIEAINRSNARIARLFGRPVTA